MYESASEDDAGVGDHVVFGKDPTRPHMDFALAVFCEENETGDIRDQGGYADAEHEPEIRIAAVEVAPDDVDQNTERESDLEPTAESGGSLFGGGGATDRPQRDAVDGRVGQHIERIRDQSGRVGNNAKDDLYQKHPAVDGE